MDGKHPAAAIERLLEVGGDSEFDFDRMSPVDAATHDGTFRIHDPASRCELVAENVGKLNRLC